MLWADMRGDYLGAGQGAQRGRYEYAPAFAFGNFHRAVFYGHVSWPSHSDWIVPGTDTDIDRCG